jgi:nucleolin
MSTITEEQFNSLLEAMKNLEARMKKQHNQVGVALKALEQKIEESAKESSEKPAKEKRKQSEGQKAWISFVKEVLAEMQEDNPKATYKDAMAEASKRKDLDDPAGAKKRAEARAKRAEAKEKKSAKSSKSSSKAASDSESSSEEEKPKKKATKKPAKKEAVSDSDSD